MKHKSSNSGSSSKNSGDLLQIMDRVKWNILPFFLSVVVYALVCVPMEHQTLFGMVVKCLPIISLQYFVVKNGVSLSNPEHSFQRKILLGLIFSSIGDAFLDFPQFFMHGTIAFAVAQISNIFAFGVKPFNFMLALKVFGLMSLPLVVVLPKLSQEDPTLLLIISLYTPLLKGMIWRALSRASFDKNERDWPKLFGALGAISFGLSDTSLALNKYWQSLPYAQALIMTTYYAAQFGIALSVIGPSKAQIKTGKKAK